MKGKLAGLAGQALENRCEAVPGGFGHSNATPFKLMCAVQSLKQWCPKQVPTSLPLRGPKGPRQNSNTKRHRRDSRASREGKDQDPKI